MSLAAPAGSALDQPVGTHDGLFYRSPEEYLAGVVPFLEAGLSADQPAFVAVPEPNLSTLLAGLIGSTPAVEFADMTLFGRNPARIIPTVRRFVDSYPDQRVRFVGEPIWPGRSAAEISEAVRHEAMLNTAFGDVAVDILCLYDVGQLGADAVADVWRTHPAIVDNGERLHSPHYTDPQRIYGGDEPLLPEPPASVQVMAVEADDLTRVRHFVRRFAADVGLSPRRTHDLVLAVNEIATNTILYTPDAGTLRIWSEPTALVCEIRDAGHITDALAGRRSPVDSADHGRGLWMANQLCDLVQLRSSAAGTTIRLHVDR
jgi:anti-sigma regulatory factor (Ser/Thr protein kinase)